jgi:tRNA nucleotidyltransferase/poly(A) polymerase
MVSKKDYSAEAVRAAHSVLIELIRLLGEYRDHIVLVGGWVPDLLFGNPNSPHIGSIDVDLALDHRNLKDEGYRTIRRLLLGVIE